MTDYHLNHLKELESESIYTDNAILRLFCFIFFLIKISKNIQR
jgi:hypothetical protein